MDSNYVSTAQSSSICQHQAMAKHQKVTGGSVAAHAILVRRAWLVSDALASVGRRSNAGVDHGGPADSQPYHGVYPGVIRHLKVKPAA